MSDEQKILTPFDGLGPEDLALPEMKLVQDRGGEEARAAGANSGDFYCSVTGSAFNGEGGLELVVVKINKNRTYWGREELNDEPPQCASHDGVANVHGEPCDPCPYGVKNDAAWLLDAKERRTKCNINYNILAINLWDMMPVMIRGSGVSATPVRELFTMLSGNASLRGEWHRAKVLMTRVVKKTNFGDVYALKFRLVELIADTDDAGKKQISNLKALNDQLRGLKLLAEEFSPKQIPVEAAKAIGAKPIQVSGPAAKTPPPGTPVKKAIPRTAPGAVPPDYLAPLEF